jgi:hypothetical protein
MNNVSMNSIHITRSKWSESVDGKNTDKYRALFQASNNKTVLINRYTASAFSKKAKYREYIACRKGIINRFIKGVQIDVNKGVYNERTSYKKLLSRLIALDKKFTPAKKGDAPEHKQKIKQFVKQIAILSIHTSADSNGKKLNWFFGAANKTRHIQLLLNRKECSKFLKQHQDKSGIVAYVEDTIPEVSSGDSNGLFQARDKQTDSMYATFAPKIPLSGYFSVASEQAAYKEGEFKPHKPLLGWDEGGVHNLDAHYANRDPNYQSHANTSQLVQMAASYQHATDDGRYC